MVGRAGYLAAGAVRSLRKVEIWAPHVLGQMARIGVDSVPVALFVATFTGIVLALQASYSFTGAIPLYFVGTLVGKTMILELGPVLTGLVLSGRVGANIAAELGTMRVTEQVDALETLAYDPNAYLVVPRVLAGAIMFPVVVMLANGIGVLAGWGTSLALLDMSSHEFLKGLRLFFQPWDVWFSAIKSLTFGLTVTSVGCFFGLHTAGGAEGVGRSTTRAVVASSMIILVLDAFLTAVLL
jgi:phospholipid/cholesterol/gamma-HCH transport system permease protein